MSYDFFGSLNIGTIINGKYIIEQVTDQNIIGFTYIVRDTSTNEYFKLNEYFPEGVARREGNMSVAVVSNSYFQLFNSGLSDFMNEAAALSSVRSANIVKVLDYFQFNNTAYYVNELFDGVSLYDYANNAGGKVSIAELRNIINPVMEALEEVHSKGIYHYNISPYSIFITSNGIVKLTGFSNTLVMFASNSGRFDAIINYGFSPKEFYSRNSPKGAYSDVYSLAATIYTSLTGVTLPDAIDRFDGENIAYPSMFAVPIFPNEEQALKKALSINETNRFQNITGFRQAFNSSTGYSSGQSYNRNPVPQPYTPATPNPPASNAPVNKSKGKFPKWIIPAVAAFVVVVVVVIGVVACMLLFGSNPAKDFKYSVNSSEVVIEKYIGNDDTASIPSEIEGKPVEVIGANAFNGSPLKSITIPNSVKKIEKGAFSYSVITEFVIPENVTEIGENAFRYSSIESITVPGSVKNLSKYIFSDCNSLKSVKLNNGVTKIGEYAFNNCKKLNDISLPDSLDTISSDAFYNCKGLKKIKVPNHVSSIKSYAFSGCSELKSFEASGTSTSSKKGSFDAYVFSGCNKLKKITIPKSIKTLKEHFISSHKVVETVKMQEGLKKIGNNAFMFCSKLKKADIPNSVTAIGSSAFWGCKKLKSVSIPLKIKVIKKYTFNECKSLKKIYIPSTVKKVETGAFEKCTSAKRLTIGYKIKKIGKYVFSGCNKIKTLVVPSRMKTVPTAAFFGMKGVKKLVIPKSVKRIKTSAFLSCRKLKTVYVAKKCKIHKFAFPYGVKVKKIK